MERRSPTGIDRREAVETTQTCQSTSTEMERRSPTGIDRREAVETPQTCQSTSTEMERRSPTGIDRREAVETPQTCQSTSATMERRSPTGIDRREAVETALSQKAGSKPSGFAAISFSAVLPHRGGADPQQRNARKWSAGLRPASRPERAAMPHIAKPLQVAAAQRQAANPPGSLPSVSPRC